MPTSRGRRLGNTWRRASRHVSLRRAQGKECPPLRSSSPRPLRNCKTQEPCAATAAHEAQLPIRARMLGCVSASTSPGSTGPHLRSASGLRVWAAARARDEDINTIVTPTAPTVTYTGPITRARARQLNYQVLSFLGNDSNVHENMMLPKLDTFVLLTNEGPSFEKDEHWSKNKHGDDGMRMGNKNGVTSDDFRTLKPP